MKIEFFLNLVKEHQDKGLSEYRSGDWKEARSDLLQAARYMFKAAEATTDERLKVIRHKKGQELLNLAKKIDPAHAPKPGEKPRALKIAEDRDSEDGEGGRFKAVERPSLKFDDIAGLEDVKEQIRLKMLYPFSHPEKAEKFGIRSGGGILLWGPPGTGKTMMARAIAGEIEAAFFTVKPSEIMSKFVGDAEKNIAELFATAREHAISIIFIDEIESLVPARRDSQSSVMQRVVPQILAELEGFDTAGKNPLLFIGATNEPWSLDPAVLRPGRFDEKVYVGLPDQPARRKILEINLSKKPLAEDVDLDALAERLEGYSGADIRNICQKAAADAFIESIETDSERSIRAADLDAVLVETKPSVKKSDLERFVKYGRES